MADTDVLIVGAGPAGLSAAIETARAGLAVTVVDENLDAGGQIYRQIPQPFRPLGSARPDPVGASLIEQAGSTGVQFRFGCTAWGLFEPGVMEIADRDGASTIRAQRIVIAAGAYDRAVPVPGWTLPGVFTVGGAQALLKSQRLLVGQRILLAGVGPLLLVVASQLQEAGATVVAVAEPVSALSAGLALPGFLAAPQLLIQGLKYRRTLVHARVPWLSNTALLRIEGDGGVERAVVCRVDRDWRPIRGQERAFEVDAVCIGYGLIPSSELPRICGCAMEYDRPSRTWVPWRDRDLESSVPGVFIAGDGAGIAGAIVAAHEGRLAGLAIARQLGRLGDAEAAKRAEPHRRQLGRLQKFRRAMDRAYALRPGLYEIAGPETLICRCEEVMVRDLEEAARDGANSLAALKSFTRCGMGPCQGRMCMPAAAEWLARQLDRSPEAVGLPPIAPPAKPVVELGSL